MEREIISSITKSALTVKKSEGVILGRKKNVSKLDNHKDDIIKMINDGVKLNMICKKIGCSSFTLSMYIHKYGLKNNE
jgi:DNA invertase Pin-like site-specific DNA recombinase